MSGGIPGRCRHSAVDGAEAPMKSAGPPRKEMQKAFAGAVAVHGVFGNGPTLDAETFGFDRYRRNPLRGSSPSYSMGGMKPDHHARRTGRTRRSVFGGTAGQRRSA